MLNIIFQFCIIQEIDDNEWIPPDPFCPLKDAASQKISKLSVQVGSNSFLCPIKKNYHLKPYDSNGMDLKFNYTIYNT